MPPSDYTSPITGRVGYPILGVDAGSGRAVTSAAPAVLTKGSLFSTRAVPVRAPAKNARAAVKHLLADYVTDESTGSVVDDAFSTQGVESPAAPIAPSGPSWVSIAALGLALYGAYHVFLK